MSSGAASSRSAPDLRPRRPLPFSLAFYDHLLRLDGDGRWWFESLWSEERDDFLGARLRGSQGTCHRPRQTPTVPHRAVASHPVRRRSRPGRGGLSPADPRRRPVPGQHLRPARLTPGRCADRPVRHRGGDALRPDRAAFLAGPSSAVASLSPELFLERHGRRVRSAPIKGTRPRLGRPRHGLRPARGPAGLGEGPGRERDDRRPRPQRPRPGVRARVDRACKRCARPGRTRASGTWCRRSPASLPRRRRRRRARAGRVPPGSVTGAPKIAAMNVIAELESTAARRLHGRDRLRQPARGTRAERRDPHLRVQRRPGVARRRRRHRGRLRPRRRGGRMRDQGRAAAGRDRRRAGRLPGPAVGIAPRRRLAARHRGRCHAPIRSGGVFETLRVAGGRPVALELHLARLARQRRRALRPELPPELAAELRRRRRPGGRRPPPDRLPTPTGTIELRAHARWPRGEPPCACAQPPSPAGSAPTSGATAACSTR